MPGFSFDDLQFDQSTAVQALVQASWSSAPETLVQYLTRIVLARCAFGYGRRLQFTVAGQEVGHLRKINAPIEQEGLFEGF